ncbi:hypothetical protein DL89DRAFT_291073 [Linderina pennispora]|uniref:Tetratricopeptide SHNi-TPR domain-containing protein n=1 Tax=Linderina pennispora TaxID=61395 RepID=A0A1Y1WJI6_9FUNG|nr:uncharacterized protein DL89DRAFT_291073 [Linderina pennispora]ORX73386.1 hypothetical protein DL89DRAFT_291073 [Linderina pennispora]
MSSDKGKQADTSDPYAAVLPVIADLVESGTRAFALSNWEEAIEHFGELSSLTEQTFGQNSARYADSLVMYGRALLQHAIEQNALLAQKTLAEAATGAKPTEEAEQEAMPSKANIAFEGEPDFRQIEEAEQEEQQEDEDEEDDFGAAWAVLDVARVIQESNASDSKARLKYAETLMLLGDVSMESENFAQACVDFKSALEVKKQLLDSDSRELAELFYKVALAHEYNNETAQALELMADVERILASRLEKAGDKDEREGLEDVLEDVRAKIAEWKLPKKKVDLNALTPGESALAEKAREMFKSALESGQVNDLTSLVKKRKGKEPEDSGAKRKSEDEGEDEDADAKRPKNA